MDTLTIEFSGQTRKEFERILSECHDQRMAVIPTLHLCQREFGWVSPEVMRYTAHLLHVSPAHVLGVCSFYTMFHREPVGRYCIWLCATLPCALCGSDRLADHLCKTLGIAIGETTPDGVFTLKKTECLGSCGTAPVVQINDEYYENITIEKIDAILDTLRAKALAAGVTPLQHVLPPGFGNGNKNGKAGAYA